MAEDITPDDLNRLHSLNDGGPGLQRFLDAAHRSENPLPIDQDAVRGFILDSDHGELLENMLGETLRLGRMRPEAEKAIDQDKHAIIASIRDPEVELTPDLARRRDYFFRSIAPILPVAARLQGNNTDLDEAVKAAKKVIED